MLKVMGGASPSISSSATAAASPSAVISPSNTTISALERCAIGALADRLECAVAAPARVGRRCTGVGRDSRETERRAVSIARWPISALPSCRPTAGDHRFRASRRDCGAGADSTGANRRRCDMHHRVQGAQPGPADRRSWPHLQRTGCCAGLRPRRRSDFNNMYKRARVSLTLRLICGYLLRSLQPFLTCIYGTLLDI